MKPSLFILIVVCLKVASTGDSQRRFTSLALEGGGSKAISYVGAMLAFKDLGYFKNDRYTFDNIGGTSAGCVVGLFISLDIKPSDFEALVYKIDIFQNSVDFDPQVLFKSKDAPEKSSEHTWFNSIIKTFMLIIKARDIVDLWLDYDSPGLSTEEMFIKFLSEVVLPMSPHKNAIKDLRTLTFEQLYAITHHNLHCFATQLNDKIIKEYSSDRTANEKILKAVYASITLPGIFKPLSDGFGNTLVDGGLLYNFPITMNDYGSKIDEQILGLSLNTKLEDKQSLMSKSKDVAFSKTKFEFNPLSTFDYLSAIYSVVINRESLSYSRDPKNKDRIIYLDSPINTFDFDIDPSLISLAINKAYLNTISFMKKIDDNID